MRSMYLTQLLSPKVRLAATVFAATCLGAAPAARADLFTVTGNTTAATAQINITSLSTSQLQFSFTNTSGGALLGTKVTGIGFDVPGAGTYTLLSPSPNSTAYDFSTDPGNTPQFNTAELDFALITGKNFPGGHPPASLTLNQSSATYTIGGNFQSLSQLQVAQSAYVRFQSIPSGEGSDVGHRVTPSNAIPEPGTCALVGTALLPLAGAVRRRRSVTRKA